MLYKKSPSFNFLFFIVCVCVSTIFFYWSRTTCRSYLWSAQGLQEGERVTLSLMWWTHAHVWKFYFFQVAASLCLPMAREFSTSTDQQEKKNIKSDDDYTSTSLWSKSFWYFSLSFFPCRPPITWYFYVSLSFNASWDGAFLFQTSVSIRKMKKREKVDDGSSCSKVRNARSPLGPIETWAIHTVEGEEIMW